MYDGCSFEDDNKVIDYYESVSGLHVGILRSQLGTYQLYGCKQHQGCAFHMSFGHEYQSTLSSLNTQHLFHAGYENSKTTKQQNSKDVRMWKKDTRDILTSRTV